MADEKKPREKRKPSRYVLCVATRDEDAEYDVYRAVSEPFAKPSEAWKFAAANKLTGTLAVLTLLGVKTALVKVEERYELK